ncbi:hypothetical protein AB0395_34845 [Streptosporangium sp. NPDC051023]|uniref:hypothetical protein n=1 Tax=Streptosporangium sp. NPDC051023 TaxID=3155410 RepID=UPI00344B195C
MTVSTYNRGHRHSIDDATGYRIVQTITPEGDRDKRITLATTDGCTSYGKALGVRAELQSHSIRMRDNAYFVIEPIYACGCREYPEVP